MYFARWNGGGIALSVDSQMDAYLSKGASIYKIEGDKEELIATPEEGFLVERPIFPVVQSMTNVLYGTEK